MTMAQTTGELKLLTDGVYICMVWVTSKIL